jgi:hypothetical protein
MPEYVARAGFVSGRRLHLAGAAASHEHLAVYEVESIAAFNEALAAGPPWGPWHAEIDRYVCDWERTYYRLLSLYEVDDRPGDHWVIVKVDFTEDSPRREAEFNDWYAGKHVPELCAHPGFHRAWRLVVEPDENDLGPRRQRYWAVWEVDAPEDFTNARARRAADGIPPWDGLWGQSLENVEMPSYELIDAVDHATAVARIAEGSVSR